MSSLLNAAAALLVAGVVGQIEEGIERAALTIDAGLGAELLERLRAERRAAEAARPADDAAEAADRDGHRMTGRARADSSRARAPNVVAEIAARRASGHPRRDRRG